MENVTIMDKVLEKKMEGYGFEKADFTAPQELTVTITLCEYRDLVSKVATRQAAIDEANKDKYTRDSENTRLKEELATLKAELYEYQKKAQVNNVNNEPEEVTE